MRIDKQVADHPRFVPGEGYERIGVDSSDTFVTTGMPVRPDLFRTATRYAIEQINKRLDQEVASTDMAVVVE